MKNKSKFGNSMNLDAKDSGFCQWQSPSNIALVKYWGKKHEQIPCNPSISFTLKNAHTTTVLEWERKETSAVGDVDFTFYFHGQKKESFRNRIQQYLNRIAEEIPLLQNYQLTISSENTFPHSSGIASSASAMNALAAALTDMERQITGSAPSGTERSSDFNQRISRLSRLGSGSACRSNYANAALWGQCSYPGSSNEYAVGLESILHPAFHHYKDAILLVDQDEKKVSSSAGHQLMNDNPYAEVRYGEARKNTKKLLKILKSGDLEAFTALVEEEAMTLHALMMASSPGYILMHPNTLIIIQRIQAYRRETGIPLCFTLDAGPNIHLLYPDQQGDSVKKFIQSNLASYCTDGKWIDDKMGIGTHKVK